MITQADRPDADVEYLTSAIIREALANKFQKLFGRDPVSTDVNEPQKVEDTRIPDMVSESVNPHIASMLKASAIEAAKNSRGEIPSPPNSTLLYRMLDDDPAEISLQAVPEYLEIDEASRDATEAAVAGQDDINIEEGTAYVIGDSAVVDIGVFVDNKAFAAEFQYELEQAGGDALSVEEKENVFDNIFTQLPGGNEVNENVRSQLLSVVGLTGAQT
jgi:hypothetical protein